MSALENNDVQGSSLSDLEVRILDFERAIGGALPVRKSLQLKSSSTSPLLVTTNYSMT